MTDQYVPSYATLRARFRRSLRLLPCRVGLHAWKNYGTWKEGDEWRSMWSRCECGMSRYLVPYHGKRPLLILGRGIRRGR